MSAQLIKLKEIASSLPGPIVGEGSHKGHHHFVEKSLVAGVEGNKVRLSANAAVAVTMEEERSSKPV